jgi:CheY-like chemotaxis protein
LEPIKPDVEPLTELRGAFKQYFQQSRELYDYIHNYPNGLRWVIEQLPGSERLLLVVDQFEEVFTVCFKEEERRRFIELLTQVAEIPESRLAIVTTMRADFLEPCLSYESLTRLIQNQAVYMPPLVGAELEEAIATPAKHQGYSFGNGLLGAILHDVGQEKECLPLLQFALTELWEKRDRKKHQLTVEQYQALGKVAGALNRHAEKIYTYKDFLKESPQQERSPQEQEWIKRIFLKLVRTGEGVKDTRQRRPKAEFLAKDKSADEEANAKVLDELIQGRLLVTGQDDRQGEAWVDLAHEALMNGWKQFARWRQENRQLRRLLDRVEDALRIWQEEPKEGNLMMGALLTQVREKWLELAPDLNDVAKEFYHLSDIHEQEERESQKQAEIFKEVRSAKSEMMRVVSLPKDPPVILVVDDDRMMRQWLRRFMEKDGYQVVEAANGEQGLEAYKRLKPDLVLLDALMPVMDGFTCCTQLRKLISESSLQNEAFADIDELYGAASTPIVMFTGLDDPESVDRAYAVGASDFFFKPIHSAALRQRVRILIQNFQASQRLKNIVDMIK